MYSPVLSLPPRRASRWLAEADPTYARAWLDSLPLGDSAESAREIYQALYELNRIELPAPTRMELMALYDRAAAAVCGGLQSALTHAVSPLGQKKRQLAELVRRLHTEMAYGYKCCLRDLSRARLLLRRKIRSAVCIERTLYHLSEILLRSYLVYLPYPGGIWRETHELYRLAESLGFADQPLDVGGEGAPRASIAGRYVQMLLLALVNPYQLPHNTVQHVAAFLARWGAQARLTARGGQKDLDGCFLVDLEADAPPIPLAKSDQRLESKVRVLDARELLRTVQQFALELQQGKPIEQASFGVDCLDSTRVDLLQRMLRAWGESARRRYVRRRQSSSVFVCVGLEALCYFASGQRPFADYLHALASLDRSDADRTEAADVAFVELEENGDAGIASSPAGADASGPNQRAERWQLRDIGPQGMSLARQGGLAFPVRVGDLIGVQQPTDFGRWRAGVIRWLRNPEADRVEVGVEFLAANVAPSAVYPTPTSGRPRAVPALRLPAVDVMRRPPTLLLPRGVCQVGDELELIEEAAAARRLRVLRLLERTGSFEQVVYADATAPRIARGD